MSMQRGDLCLVTGVSGYLASWLGKYLIEEGFRVRGTVRSVKNDEQLDKMRELLPGAEFVEADLRSENGWDQAVKDVKWVFHVASPQAVKTESDRTGGATKGTEYVLKAALKSGTVKKIVVTSSVAAVAYGHPQSKLTYSEDDWTNVDVATYDYFRSKTLAEKLAWSIINDKTRNPHGVALSTVNPSMILGPSLVPWGRYSSETIKNTAEGKMPVVPDMVSYYVDVRDCARMHIAIMNDPKTDGHRHLSYNMKCQLIDLSRIIRDNYSHLGFSPKQRVLPKSLFWLLKFFSGDVRSLYSWIGTTPAYKTKYPNVYTYQHADLQQTVKDTIDSMLANKILLPRRK